MAVRRLAIIRRRMSVGSGANGRWALADARRKGCGKRDGGSTVSDRSNEEHPINAGYHFDGLAARWGNREGCLSDRRRAQWAVIQEAALKYGTRWAVTSAA